MKPTQLDNKKSVRNLLTHILNYSIKRDIHRIFVRLFFMANKKLRINNIFSTVFINFNLNKWRE